MNWESCERPKKSRITALSALGLISFCGVIPSTLMSNSVMRSLTRRSVRARPTRHWLASSSHGAHAPAAQMIDVIKSALASPQIDQILDRGDEILIGQNALRRLHVDSQFLIDLVAADASQIVFFGIEKEPLEQSPGVGHRGRV